MFLLQGLLLFIFAILLVLGFIQFDQYWEITGIKPNKWLAVAILPLILFIGTLCITFVPANEVGIKYSAFTGVNEDTLSEGIAFKSPVDKVYTISTTVQEKAIENLSVQTKDAQWVSMTLNVKYQVNSNNAYKVFKSYKTLDNLSANLIANAAQRSIEEVTTKYNVIEVLGESRNAMYTEIENQLKERLAVEGVDLKFVTMIDTDAGAAIEKAIADEAVSRKAVETALQNQEKAKIEAETKLIEAKGEAEANAVKTKALTDEVLLEMWINKWNGQQPVVSGSNGAMIDISSLLGK